MNEKEGCASRRLKTLKQTKWFIFVETSETLMWAIKTLLPFLDSYGIMRAKRKQRKADMEYQTKQPIILHSQHWAVKLVPEEMH